MVTSPAGNDEQKEFLGYDWSNRKGAEGIQIQTAGGKLYNDDDRTADHTVSANIRNAFAELHTPSVELEKYLAWYRLQDMIDFSRVEFNKEIQTALTNIKIMKFVFPMVKFGDYTTIKGGNTFPKQYQGNKNEKDYPFYKVGDMNSTGNEIYMNQSENYISETVLFNDIKGNLLKEDTIIFPKVGMAIGTNKKRMLTRISAVDNNTMGITCNNRNEVLPKYLFEYLNCYVKLIDLASKSNPPSISATELSQKKFPLPPVDIQQQIVYECEKIDAECETAKVRIDNVQKQITNTLKEAEGTKIPLKTVCDYVSEHISIAECDIADFISTDNMLQSFQGIISYKGNPQITNVISYQQCDILVSNIRPYLKKIWFADRQGGASPDVLVFRVKNTDRYLPEYIFYCMRQQRFFDHMMSGKKGLKMPRGDKNVTMEYQLSIPSFEDQNAIVAQIQKFEQQIDAAQKVLDSAFARKQAILDKYLQ